MSAGGKQAKAFMAAVLLTVRALGNCEIRETDTNRLDFFSGNTYLAEGFHVNGVAAGRVAYNALRDDALRGTVTLGALERASEYLIMQKDTLHRDRMDLASALGLHERMAEEQVRGSAEEKKERVAALETSKEASEAINQRLHSKETEVADATKKLAQERECREKLDRQAVQKEEACRRLQSMVDHLQRLTEQARAELVRPSQAAATDQARLVTDLEEKLMQKQGELGGEKTKLRCLERNSRPPEECLQAQINGLRYKLKEAKKSEEALRRERADEAAQDGPSEVSSVGDEEVAQRMAELSAEADRAGELEAKLADLERAHAEGLARARVAVAEAASVSKEERARDNLEKLEKIEVTMARHTSRLTEETREFLEKEMSYQEEAKLLAATNAALQEKMAALEREKHQAVQEAAEQNRRAQERIAALTKWETQSSAPASTVTSSKGAGLRERQKNLEPLAAASSDQLLVSYTFIPPAGTDERGETISRKRHYYSAITAVATTCEAKFHQLQRALPETLSPERATELHDQRATEVRAAMNFLIPPAIVKCRNNPGDFVWITGCVLDLNAAVMTAVETGFQNEAEHHLKNGTFDGAFGGPAPRVAEEEPATDTPGAAPAGSTDVAVVAQLTSEALQEQLARFSSRVGEVKARLVAPEHLAVGDEKVVEKNGRPHLAGNSWAGGTRRPAPRSLVAWDDPC